MANPWGSNMRQNVLAAFIPSADTSCSAGSATTVITSGAIALTDPGGYQPLIMGVLDILLGATAPSALTVSFILGSGSAVDTYTVEPGLLTNNAELYLPIFLVGGSSATDFTGSGSTINVQVTPTGQAVTAKKVGSRLFVQFLRV